MSIEFNGNKEIRISNPDVDPKSKALIAQDTVKLNPSEIGDLFASRIKRELGIKDFSHVLGAHGGLLDRLDSIIFAII